MRIPRTRLSLLFVAAGALLGCTEHAATPPSAGWTLGQSGSAGDAIEETGAHEKPTEMIGGQGPAGADTRPDLRRFKPTARLRDVHFDFDSYVIRAEDAEILDAGIDWMLSNPGYLVLLEGHSDERGTNEYNMALGDHRAKATMNYLIAHGVPSERLITISYGEERPACTDRTEACWAKNRRAHFLVHPAEPPRRATPHASLR